MAKKYSPSKKMFEAVPAEAHYRAKFLYELYEKVAFKFTSAEPPPRWAIGTGQLSCLQFRPGPIARRGMAV